MSYHSEQHLLYGSTARAQVPALPGRTEQLPTDRGRLVIGTELRYFATHGEAYRASKALRQRFINASAQALCTDGWR